MLRPCCTRTLRTRAVTIPVTITVTTSPVQRAQLGVVASPAQIAARSETDAPIAVWTINGAGDDFVDDKVCYAGACEPFNLVP